MRRTAAIVLGIAACAILAATLAGAAGAAKVRVGTLVLTADGGFEPRQLPRREYAPIEFHGHADIKTTNGTTPPPLQRIRLDFDRDGLLTTTGLATCPPARIEAATPGAARRACAAALVGTGNVEATIAVPGLGGVEVRSPLSLFNGSRQGGNATVVAHAQTSFPALETYVVVIPVERLRSRYYSYRATFDVPEIAGGFGSITHVDAKVGRRYRVGGVERSYVSARCSDNILETIGFASFTDGTVISGTIFKPCRAVPE